MNNSLKPVCEVLNGKKPSRKPIWFMRQAGRYLPEYRKIRKEAGSFLKMCLTPSLASEITLQPLRRFDLDAAILFADILLIPKAMGMDLHFEEKKGPVLSPYQEGVDLSFDQTKIESVFETLKLVKPQLKPHQALIGFAGSPWTVACYILQGEGKNGFPVAQKWVQEKPDQLEILLSKITRSTVSYLSAQIEAGADLIQLFESHAGLLSQKDKAFERFIVKPTKEIVRNVQEKYPQIPFIGFPRGVKTNEAKRFFQKTRLQGLSLDYMISLEDVKNELSSLGPLQGNLSPSLLLKGGEEMKAQAKEIMESFGPLHIFNLGHGVLKETPPEHIEDLITFIRNQDT